mmetsp:Transcript_24086/g.77663  ORF Transcript_24086/g.77663 Transcript_24086/m.77663 type:complete len:84 (+) Transcript_24086:646-897(+)
MRRSEAAQLLCATLDREDDGFVSRSGALALALALEAAAPPPQDSSSSSSSVKDNRSSLQSEEAPFFFDPYNASTRRPTDVSRR